MDDGFGRRVRQARERVGLTQEELAGFAGLERGWIAKIERGAVDPRRRTALDIYCALADRLTDLPLGWFLTGDSDAGNLQRVKRREAMRLAAAILPASLPLMLEMLDTERLASPAALDVALLVELEVLTQRYGRLRPTLSARELLPMLDAHLATLRARFTANGTTALKGQLMALAADTANLAAWASLALERRSDARAYLAWTEKLARASGDTEALALVLHLRSDLASPIPSGGLDGDAAAARRHIDEARAAAGLRLAPHLQTSLLLHSAEVHAFAGDEALALRDLEAAEKVFPGPKERHDRPHASLDQGSLAGYRGSVLQMLGRPQEAIAVMGPAIAASRPPRARAVALTEKAAAHAQRREVDESCAALAIAIDIALARGDIERGRRIAAVRHRHLAPWAHEPQVAELGERLVAIL